MSYGGSALSTRGVVDGSDNSMTLESKNKEFELPSRLMIGGSYDFLFNDTTENSMHKLTVAATFLSNAFDKDQGSLGFQYSYKGFLMLRAGYLFEQNIYSSANTTKAYAGPSVGATVDVPFGENGRKFGVDYSFRAPGPFTGTHTFGVKLVL